MKHNPSDPTRNEVRTFVSDSLYDRLQALADRHGCSVYALARTLLIAGLQLMEKEAGA